MKKIKVAYLPLYIKLYDDFGTDRSYYEMYMNKLVTMLEEKNIEIVMADEVCRVESEFEKAVEKFNSDSEIVAVVTQHLAYSPSLESIGALKKLKAPIIVFDTTPDYELLSVAEQEGRIGANHGIHGVQDMCCMLKRNGISYDICCGHALHSNVVDELCGYIRAAQVANTFKNARIGMLGGEFKGMGDFRVDDEYYKETIGVETVRPTKEAFETYYSNVTDEEVKKEIALDYEKYDVACENKENYYLAVKTGLAIRRWMDDEKIDGITVNFLNADESGLPKMPFAECCKIMARGKGYAGEGDNLTAGLVAALINVYPETSFVEMFCPDWEKDIILLSHMGEFNPDITAWKPVIIDKPFKYNSMGDTVSMVSCLKAGDAVYVNLAPMTEGYSLIISNVEMLDVGSPDSAYATAVQGWMKPSKPITEFLKSFSMAGGTHHSALVYGVDINEIEAFGKMMGFDVVVI